MALTDTRVAHKKAPFDHPELFVAKSGVEGAEVMDIPAVGKEGVSEPLKPFLNVNHQELGVMKRDFVCSQN